MRIKRPAKASNAPRVTVPISHALKKAAVTDFFMQVAVTERLVEYIFDQIERGHLDDYRISDNPETDLGMTLSMKIRGVWYHLEFFNIGNIDD